MVKNKIKFLAVVFVVLCCTDIFAAALPYQKVLIINSAANVAEQNLLKNMRTVFNMEKVNYKIVDMHSHLVNKEIAALTNDDLLILNSQLREEMMWKEPVLKFIHGGGNIFIPLAGDNDETFKTISGIKEIGEAFYQTGFNVDPDLFPGFCFVAAAFKNRKSYSHKIKLSKNIRVLARFNDGSPAAWITRFGAGKVLMTNSLFFEEALLRGVFAQFATLLNDYFLYSVINAKVFQIDDFPFPVPEGTEYIITNEYDGRSYEEFYKDIWWPQMKQLAKKYKLQYTCLIVTNYENMVTMPPKKISPKEREVIKYYVDDITKCGYELGIHGYNHVSLIIQFPEEMKKLGYPLWKSTDDMATTLLYLKQVLNETIGKRKYTTYVAPSNLLSTPGKAVVKKVFPDIDCFAGISESNSGGEKGVLTQEIEPDANFPGVWELPRTSDGYIYTPFKMWLIFNDLAWNGLFSHFVHPDDVLDDERSGNLMWSQLYKNLQRIMAEITSRRPGLRGMTVRNTIAELKKRHKTKVYSRRKGKEITISYSNMKTAMYHYLRLNKFQRIKTVKNGEYTLISSKSKLYLIKGIRSPVKITLE